MEPRKVHMFALNVLCPSCQVALQVPVLTPGAVLPLPERAEEYPFGKYDSGLGGHSGVGSAVPCRVDAVEEVEEPGTDVDRALGQDVAASAGAAAASSRREREPKAKQWPRGTHPSREAQGEAAPTMCAVAMDVDGDSVQDATARAGAAAVSSPRERQPKAKQRPRSTQPGGRDGPTSTSGSAQRGSTRSETTPTHRSPSVRSRTPTRSAGGGATPKEDKGIGPMREASADATGISVEEVSEDILDILRTWLRTHKSEIDPHRIANTSPGVTPEDDEFDAFLVSLVEKSPDLAWRPKNPGGDPAGMLIYWSASSGSSADALATDMGGAASGTANACMEQAGRDTSRPASGGGASSDGAVSGVSSAGQGEIVAGEAAPFLSAA